MTGEVPICHLGQRVTKGLQVTTKNANHRVVLLEAKIAMFSQVSKCRCGTGRSSLESHAANVLVCKLQKADDSRFTSQPRKVCFRVNVACSKEELQPLVRQSFFQLSFGLLGPILVIVAENLVNCLDRIYTEIHPRVSGLSQGSINVPFKKSRTIARH